MRVKVLGSAAGGGFPQWNCGCENCRRVRQGTLCGGPRTQVQIAISPDDANWFLLSASPDLPRQIESFPKLRPAQSRGTPIAAFVLPGADLDQVLGLIMLRESQPLRVYATPSIHRIIMDNNIIFAMVRNQIQWEPMVPGREFELISVDGGKSPIKCLPLTLDGHYPHYVDSQLAASMPPEEAVLGLRIESPTGKRMVYMPGVPGINPNWMQHLEASDLVLCDGTFWTDDELIRIQGSGRTALQMGHIPISGPQGSMALLAHVLRPRKVYIHVNNTNPILDEESREYRRVREAGWEVARDGMEFEL